MFKVELFRNKEGQVPGVFSDSNPLTMNQTGILINGDKFVFDGTIDKMNVADQKLYIGGHVDLAIRIVTVLLWLRRQCCQNDQYYDQRKIPFGGVKVIYNFAITQFSKIEKLAIRMVIMTEDLAVRMITMTVIINCGFGCPNGYYDSLKLGVWLAEWLL